MNDQSRSEDDLTLEQARARIAELEGEVQLIRSTSSEVAGFYLRDILFGSSPREIATLITELLRGYMHSIGYASEDADAWMTVEANRFALGPGDIVGNPDPSVVSAAREGLKQELAPAILHAADGRPYFVLPVFSGFTPEDIFGLMGFELTSDEPIPQHFRTITLSIAMSATLHFDRTLKIAEATRSTHCAQAAARVQSRLTGPRERDEALRLAIETLETCEEIGGAAAIVLTDLNPAISSPRLVASWGDIDADRAMTVAVECTDGANDDAAAVEVRAAGDGLHTLPVRIEEDVEAVIVLLMRADLKPVEEEMLGTIARAVTGAVARYRAGRTIEDLRRTATRHLVEAQERERSMVAADIHDGVLQQLGATAIRLELAQARVEHGDFATARTIIEDGAKEIRSCARELRALLMELRPQVLDDNGLTAALKELGRHARDVAVTITTDVPDDLGNEYSITIFRIVQEALTNVQKHAGAKHATVDVKLANGSVDIEVRDDGIGYEAAVTGPSSAGSHLGLLGMRERARMLGGRFTIEGGPGRGTLLHASLPVGGAENGDAQNVSA